MSEPHEPDSVKVLASLFSPEKELIEEGIGVLSDIFGPVDWESPELFFDRTRYYEREMGWPLHRRFVSFQELVRPDRLVDIKLKTNEVEKRYLREGKRRINIDPGTLSAERFVLATGKNYVHRIYLSAGIYADLTLLYQRGSYRPLPWTYRDYADPETIGFLNRLRAGYMKILKERRDLD